MSIRFICRCSKKMKAPDDRIGKKVLCPDCGSPVVVPDADTVTVESIDSTATSDTASALLRGTAGDGKKPRAHFAFRDDEQGAEVSELTQAVKEFSITLMPWLALIFLGSMGTYWLSSKMMGGGDDLPELGYVSGIVTLDGQPLAGATLLFKPASGKYSGSRIGASNARTDSDGKYVLNYTRDVQGAALGKHRVEIQLANENGLETLSVRYNAVSTLTAEVSPGNNDIPFNLQSQ